MDSPKIIFCDGAANKYKCGIGAVWFTESQFKDPSDGMSLVKGNKPLLVLSREIPLCTNNEAEYKSLIGALVMCLEKNIIDPTIYMDSMLIVNQVNNKWKINFPHLQELKNEVDELKKSITFTLFHVRREYNTHADKASKDCITKS